MSLETWKAEFYPVPADKVPTEDAVAHSLRKWEGLRPENLARHGVTQWNRSVVDTAGDSLEISCGSCALCVLYEYEEGGPRCGKCPLRAVRDGTSCDNSTTVDRLTSPYSAFIGGNPEPMIMWLKKAKEYEDARNASHDTGDVQPAAQAEEHGRASDPWP